MINIQIELTTEQRTLLLSAPQSSFESHQFSLLTRLLRQMVLEFPFPLLLGWLFSSLGLHVFLFGFIFFGLHLQLDKIHPLIEREYVNEKHLHSVSGIFILLYDSLVLFIDPRLKTFSSKTF